MKQHRHSSRPAPLANHLWKYRKRMGFTQKQVAMILGYVSPTHLSHYERGRKLPSLVTALKLEIVYRAPVAFLFQDLYRQLKEDLLAKDEALRSEWTNPVSPPEPQAQRSSVPRPGDFYLGAGCPLNTVTVPTTEKRKDLIGSNQVGEGIASLPHFIG